MVWSLQYRHISAWSVVASIMAELVLGFDTQDDMSDFLMNLFEEGEGGSAGEPPPAPPPLDDDFLPLDELHDMTSSASSESTRSISSSPTFWAAEEVPMMEATSQISPLIVAPDPPAKKSPIKSRGISKAKRGGGHDSCTAAEPGKLPRPCTGAPARRRPPPGPAPCQLRPAISPPPPPLAPALAPPHLRSLPQRQGPLRSQYPMHALHAPRDGVHHPEDGEARAAVARAGGGASRPAGGRAQL